MYTIISATNRVGSHTEKVARVYHHLLLNQGIDAKLITLVDLNVLERNDGFINFENEWLVPAQKFIFLMPEYNGSYPGVLKAMIDITDVKKVWWWKKALLTGVSTGRAGNLRGMDHITGSLHHMNVIVHPNKLPISVIDKIMNKEGVISSTGTLDAINLQLEQFISF
ncbi:MAG: NADPH-dependent FMN reductase [Ginsengibacter sp.]